MHPCAHSPARGPRKAPPGTDDSGYDPANPQFSPLGDAVLPLLLMALACPSGSASRTTTPVGVCSDTT